MSGGGRLTVNDLDLAHRLHERDRMLVVDLVRQTCAHGPSSTVTVTAIPVDEPPHAWVAIEVVNASRLPTSAWDEAVEHPDARYTEHSPTHWWWDRKLRCTVQWPVGPGRVDLTGGGEPCSSA